MSGRFGQKKTPSYPFADFVLFFACFVKDFRSCFVYTKDKQEDDFYGKDH